MAESHETPTPAETSIATDLSARAEQVLRESPLFPMAAFMTRGSLQLKIPKAQVFDRGDNLIIHTGAILDAAAESFLRGNSPHIEVSYRGSTGVERQHGEVRVQCAKDTMQVSYRERDSKDHNPDSMTALWEELYIDKVANTVRYHGKDGVLETQQAVDKGDILLRAVERVIIPVR